MITVQSVLQRLSLVCMIFQRAFAYLKIPCCFTSKECQPSSLCQEGLEQVTCLHLSAVCKVDVKSSFGEIKELKH